MEATNTQNPIQLVSLREAYMWLRLARVPVVNTRPTCTTMNSTNQTITRKCSERAL